MKLYDNDAYRDEFMETVYNVLSSDETNDRANQIIDAFDNAPQVEVKELPVNDPLTLEQLREMDGEPVWVERHSNFDCIPHWALVHVHRKGNVYLTERNLGQILFCIGDKVYRHKPEE